MAEQTVWAICTVIDGQERVRLNRLFWDQESAIAVRRIHGTPKETHPIRKFRLVPVEDGNDR